MASQKYTNLAQTTLGANYTAGNTSITLATGTGSIFPTAGDFTIALDDPPAFFLLCTARSTDTLTVSAAGTEGTTAISKSSGIKVTQVITAAVMNGIRSDESQFGAIASLPTSGEYLGDVYRCSDSPYTFFWNGSAWIPSIPGYGQLVLPPASGSWTTDNAGGGTFDTTYGYLYSTMPRAGAVQLRALYVTAPSAPYTLTALLQADFSGIAQASQSGDSVGCGIGFRDGTGKVARFNVGYDSGNVIIAQNWTTTTSGPSTITNQSIPLGPFAPSHAPFWLRCADNNTNLLYSYSLDGQHWVQFASQSRTTHFGSGPTQLCVINYCNGNQVITRLLSWSVV